MWKGYYGKEPFDLRLTVLRMVYRLPLIAAVTLGGCVLFGGGYYVKNVLLQGEPVYSASSRYRIEYAVAEEKDVGTVHINQTSWNTYLQTDLVLDAVRRHMEEMPDGQVPGNDELGGMLHAVLASDLRVLTTTVTSESPEKSILIAGAVERALTGEFAGEIREITDIEVIDQADSAVREVPDVRPGRAVALSGVLSCFFTVLVLLLKELGNDSIWLPSSLWKRYGLKTVGTLKSRELPENVTYFFRQGGSAVLCAYDEKTDPEEVLEGLKAVCPGTEDFSALQGSVFAPGACDVLRKAEGVLLAVPAGPHAGKQLERALEFLEQQDCRVTAALLWGADERLLARYYWLSVPGRTKLPEEGRGSTGNCK